MVKPIWLLTMTWIVPPVREAGQLRQFERLGDQTLAGKGGVAMHQDAGDLVALASSPRCCCLARTLPSTTGSTASRCDGLAASDRCTVLAADLAVGRGAEMVFDVARAVDMLGVGRVALEFGKDRGERLADEIGQHVEPAAMRHADDELADAELAPRAQDRLQRRHQRFGALDAEPLGAGIAAVEKALEGLGRGQDSQDLLLVGRGQAGRALSRVSNFCWIQARSAGTWMCMYSTPICAAIGLRAGSR